ncbi:uridine diphosphate-N-acetylglucosamine-binding protein YvcK [Demequina sp. SYSU T00068]|uniref:gluconeogenesis factor YvcK family protein n=1 Tax=Demequina lignilytica TaxID=3051663 RepID=UPI002616F2C8|nr:uridine diphosphate-N-acetylglucosamine-binding protein YvcK [Demequina sp. SYSU T00068]MDN4491210.1 uridine diphosphate-N-acetylglucosamine-binding protein YvcK [Demequina sp. SYSU T00068]
MTPAPHVVALGGGHGLYASLTALRGRCEVLTAVVTVADDGGSSGRIRAEMPVPPPGDLRMALSALCEDTDWGRTWRDVLQWRFATTGPLDGHAVGNLLIAGLWDRTGGIVEGLDWVARLLRCEGRVLPVSTEPIVVSAHVEGRDGVLRRVEGQVAVATAQGRVRDLAVSPADPAVPAATLEAIADADAVILGPGSWYTSVLTHFLVPRVAEALVAAGGRTILTLNIAHEDEETAGTDRVDDVAVLRAAAPGFVPAAVLADATHDEPRLRAAVEDWGARFVVAPMRADDAVDRHDVVRLGEQYAQLLAEVAAGGSAMRR